MNNNDLSLYLTETKVYIRVKLQDGW